MPRWSASRVVPSPRQLAWTRLVPGLPRGRQTLAGAPRPNRAGSHHTAGRAAPSVRVSDARVLHRTTKDRRVYREERKPREHGPPGDRGRSHAPQGDRSSLACGPPLIAWGSALRSTPFSAPPSFEKLLPKRGSSPSSASRRASTNRERAAPPLPFTPAAEKRPGKTPQALLEPFFPSRSLCPHSRTLSDAERVVAWSVEDGVRKRA